MTLLRRKPKPPVVEENRHYVTRSELAAMREVWVALVRQRLQKENKRIRKEDKRV